MSDAIKKLILLIGCYHSTSDAQFLYVLDIRLITFSVEPLAVCVYCF